MKQVARAVRERLCRLYTASIRSMTLTYRQEWGWEFLLTETKARGSHKTQPGAKGRRKGRLGPGASILSIRVCHWVSILGPAPEIEFPSGDHPLPLNFKVGTLGNRQSAMGNGQWAMQLNCKHNGLYTPRTILRCREPRAALHAGNGPAPCVPFS